MLDEWKFVLYCGINGLKDCGGRKLRVRIKRSCEWERKVTTTEEAQKWRTQHVGRTPQYDKWRHHNDGQTWVGEQDGLWWQPGLWWLREKVDENSKDRSRVWKSWKPQALEDFFLKNARLGVFMGPPRLHLRPVAEGGSGQRVLELGAVCWLWSLLQREESKIGTSICSFAHLHLPFLNRWRNRGLGGVHDFL